MDCYAGLAASERIGREQGKEEGKKEGKEEGRLDGKKEIIRNMLAKGFTLDQISLATNFNIDEINKLI